MSRRIDLTGQVFGRLTVLEYAGYKRGKSYMWRCRCECGAEVVRNSSDMRRGHTTSCGCYAKQRASETQTKHGLSRSSTFTVWVNMRMRCTNPNDASYEHYGGRGIKVCDRWMHSFENFLADMGQRPGALTLDRKDPNGNYEPDNCRWATPTDQIRNRRTTKRIAYNGKEQTLMEWSEEVGVEYSTLHHRIYRAKWPVGRALTEPTRSW